MAKLRRISIASLITGLAALASLTAQPVADGQGDVGIGTFTPHPSALFDLTSTNKGFLMPRMTTAQRNAIPSPALGLMIFNTDDGIPQIWSDASGAPKWDTILTTGSNAGWLTKGNMGLTNGTDNFFGTLDNVPVRVITNNAERIRIEADGDIGINTPTPSAKLDVVATAGSPAIEASTAAGVGIFTQSNGGVLPPGGTNWGLFAAAGGGSGNVGVGAVGGSAAPINNNAAVSGANDGGYGVAGNSVATGFAGVFGNATSTINPAIGVLGRSNAGTSGRFDNTMAGNSSTTLQVESNGTGNGVDVSLTNAGSVGTGLKVAAAGIGTGIEVDLTNASNGARGIDVNQTGVGPGVFATSAGGNAVWGITSSISAAGVIGDNTFGEAVVGRNRGGNGVGAVVGRNDSSGYGVRGFNTKDGIGVIGQAGISGGTGTAGRFENVNAGNVNPTVVVTTNGIGGGIDVDLPNASNGSRGIDVTQAGVGPGVFATSAGGNAVWGITSSISAAGVIGDNTFGEAVVGRNRGGNGVGAVVGRNDSSGYGVRGFNTKNGYGVLGQAGISGGTGVGGRFENVNAANVSTTLEVATNGIGNGISVSLPNASNGGRGIDVTQAGVGPGVFATSAGGNAVWGITSSISAAGVIGDNTFGEAVVGRNRGGNGVGAVVGRNDSSGYGVRGFNTKNGYGVLGQAGISGGTGVAGRFENVNAANTSDALQVVTNSAGNAARFTGNVVVNGNLTVSGTVAKGGGSFMIDHPLDPENKILYHSFVESPDMKNINDGVVKLDDKGEAWVELPEWFEALNGDFRYQLTAIGAPGPGLYIAEEITENRFKIAGGKPGMKVSWMVTGIRHDPYAEKHRIQVEVEKSEEQRGHYLHPDAYGVKVVQEVLKHEAPASDSKTLQSQSTMVPAEDSDILRSTE